MSVLWFDNITTAAFGSAISNTGGNGSIVLSNPRIIDPNPELIDIDGTLPNEPSAAANIRTERLGTLADGVSKLLIIVDSNVTLQFSMEGINSNNITKGVNEFTRGISSDWRSTL